jgi:hypothetical protein
MELSDRERRWMFKIARQYDLGIVDNDEDLTLGVPEAFDLGDRVFRLLFLRK